MNSVTRCPVTVPMSAGIARGHTIAQGGMADQPSVVAAMARTCAAWDSLLRWLGVRDLHRPQCSPSGRARVRPPQAADDAGCCAAQRRRHDRGGRVRGFARALIAMDIRRDDLSGPEIRELLEEHLQSMRSISPPETRPTSRACEGLRSLSGRSGLAQSTRLRRAEGTRRAPWRDQVHANRASGSPLRSGKSRARAHHWRGAEPPIREVSLETGSQQGSSRRAACMRALASITARRSRVTSRTRTACS